MGKLKELFDAVGAVPENAWGFLVLVLAAGLALAAHWCHGVDHDLYNVASGLGMTGAAVMHAKKD